MKKYLLLSAFALVSGYAFSATVTVVNSGFTFSPSEITINYGDTVDFQLGSIHNAVEVSESTWLANGNTPLPGFSTSYGGGLIMDLSAGVHYYVCTPHASGGMKGKIIVTAPAGIDDKVADNKTFRFYPNPSNGKFTLQSDDGSGPDAIWSDNHQQSRIEIFDITGEKIFELTGVESQASCEIDLSSAPDGAYFVRINDRRGIYTQKLIKH